MKCVDLFSGCGGMSLGFQNAGIEILASIDNWDKSTEVYNENFSHNCYLHDLTDENGALEIINKFKPEMLIGGPPCQDFSSAGKRDETLGRADLTYHFANIICRYKPKTFVMENVERIKGSLILADVIQQYKKSGYGLTAVILDASYCNTPQARKRFFLIGMMNGEDNELIPTPFPDGFWPPSYSPPSFTLHPPSSPNADVNHINEHPGLDAIYCICIWHQSVGQFLLLLYLNI